MAPSADANTQLKIQLLITKGAYYILHTPATHKQQVSLNRKSRLIDDPNTVGLVDHCLC